jgi:hypothetical protein
MSLFLADSQLSKQDHDGSGGHFVFRVFERQTALREVVGTAQGCVHDSPPFPCRTFLDLKLQLLPVRVDHYIDIVIGLRGAPQAERQAA